MHDLFINHNGGRQCVVVRVITSICECVCVCVCVCVCTLKGKTLDLSSPCLGRHKVHRSCSACMVLRSMVIECTAGMGVHVGRTA